MSSQPSAARVIRFGLFELDLSAGKLRKQDHEIKLQEQPFQVLVLLLRRPGEVVTREELRNGLWPADTFIEFDQGLNTAIKKIRLALGDSADNPRFIETLPRKGYRFIAPVEDHESSMPARAVRWRPLMLSAVVGMLLIGSSVAWFAVRRAPTAEAGLMQRRLTANASDNCGGATARIIAVTSQEAGNGSSGGGESSGRSSEALEKSLKIIGVVPARMAASRFPGKPLYPIHGRPMVEHVFLRAKMYGGWSRLVLATCDREIETFAKGKDIPVVMTGDHHTRALDRVAEAVERLGEPVADDDIVVCNAGAYMRSARSPMRAE